mmetsp:Transcript_94397/g.266665  ORF Transcript_94397/g.266665 Transcript_94397/m.266665 type:complete len:221 (-) Transcript_94397:51-713(-)
MDRIGGDAIKSNAGKYFGGAGLRVIPLARSCASASGPHRLGADPRNPRRAGEPAEASAARRRRRRVALRGDDGDGGDASGGPFFVSLRGDAAGQSRRSVDSRGGCHGLLGALLPESGAALEEIVTASFGLVAPSFGVRLARWCRRRCRDARGAPRAAAHRRRRQRRRQLRSMDRRCGQQPGGPCGPERGIPTPCGSVLEAAWAAGRTRRFANAPEEMKGG